MKMSMLSFIISLKESTNPMETRFLLADNLYCKASVPPTDKVCLWLGVSKVVYMTLFPEDGVHCWLSCPPDWDKCNSPCVQGKLCRFSAANIAIFQYACGVLMVLFSIFFSA